MCLFKAIEDIKSNLVDRSANTLSINSECNNRFVYISHYAFNELRTKYSICKQTFS